MSSPKQKYVLTVRCKEGDFQANKEVEVEPDKLAAVKMELAKQAAAVHSKHPDASSFIVTHF